MHPYPLLQTKLYVPPIRPELVSRPRLLERLNASLGQNGFQESLGFGRKLTLVSAPAGFGKTTLVSEWVRDSGLPVAWLSLDEGDNDPARFLAYVIAALRSPVLPVPSVAEGSEAEGAEADQDSAAQQEPVGRIGHGMLSAIHSPQPPPAEVVLTSLINDVAALPGRIILVLDDYHLIDAQEIHEALTFLLEHLPPQMHLVIATRDDPLLPFARLRARGQLAELRAAELRFTTSEAAEFLNRVMGLDLSAKDVAALERRTEGWIAGLQLAAITMQGHPDASSQVKSFTGSHRFVLDYLLEEVLEQQSESTQAFLLQTAILDRLSGSLCDAVRLGEAQSPSTAMADAVCFGHSEAPSSSRGTAVRSDYITASTAMADAVRSDVVRAPSTAVADAVRFGHSEAPSSSRGTAMRSGIVRAPTAQGSSQAILERLERANLFILPLDAERRWYRYHHLFSDLLRQRLRQTQPEWVPALHNRASEWYEQNGFTGEAIEHALRADDLERAASLIEAHADAIWQSGEHTRLRRWMDGLPEELAFTKPDLCILRAWDLFTGGKQDAAEQSLRAAEKAIAIGNDLAAETWPLEGDQPPGPDRNRIRGRAATIRAFLASYGGDVEGAIQYARQALETLPEQDLSWRSTAAVALSDAYSFSGQFEAAIRVRRDALEASKAVGNVYMALIASMKLAVTLRSQGHLQQAIELCQQHVLLAKASGWAQTPVAGGLFAVWGEVLAELDDLNGALDRAETGVDLAERGSDVAMIGWSNLCLMMVLFSRGDMAGAGSIIQKMQGIAQERDLPVFVTNSMAAWQARIWLAQDQLDAAYQWLREHRLEAEGELAFLYDLDYVELTEYVGLARVLIAQARLGEATTLLQRLLDRSVTLGHTSRVVQLLILQALAFEAGGEPSEAMTALEGALALAEPAGLVRTLVNEGPPMARLLNEAATRGIAPDYVRRMLAAFPDAEPGQEEPDRSQVPVSDLVEPLTEREIMVLQLIAEGLTNREIATRLYLSLNTVKSHTRNIYGKLNVHSRTQAVARAQGLGLLPDRRV